MAGEFDEDIKKNLPQPPARKTPREPGLGHPMSPLDLVGGGLGAKAVARFMMRLLGQGAEDEFLPSENHMRARDNYEMDQMDQASQSASDDATASRMQRDNEAGGALDGSADADWASEEADQYYNNDGGYTGRGEGTEYDKLSKSPTATRKELLDAAARAKKAAEDIFKHFGMPP